MLPLDAVEIQRQIEASRVRDLVREYQGGPHGSEGIERLADRPLGGAGLIVARRDVVEDRVPGHDLQRPALVYAPGAPADDDRQFRFIVKVHRHGRIDDGLPVADDRVGELGEEGGVLFIVAGSDSVIMVVVADADELAGARDRGQQGHIVEGHQRPVVRALGRGPRQRPCGLAGPQQLQHVGRQAGFRSPEVQHAGAGVPGDQSTDPRSAAMDEGNESHAAVSLGPGGQLVAGVLAAAAQVVQAGGS